MPLHVYSQPQRKPNYSTLFGRLEKQSCQTTRNFFPFFSRWQRFALHWSLIRFEAKKNMTSVTSTWTPRASHNVALTIEDPTTKGKNWCLRILREIDMCWSTVWKFHDFSITQILREINFGDFTSAKSATLAHLGALNFDFYEFLHFLTAEIYQINKIHSPMNGKNASFSTSTFSKNDFT